MSVPHDDIAKIIRNPYPWYSGTNAHGVPFRGTVITESIAQWVEEHYNKGWRDLQVTRGGVRVGGIATDVKGNRDWWSDDA